MRSRIILFVALLLALAPIVRAEDKPDPRATVESALEHFIATLEKKEVSKIYQECFAPSEMKMILRGTTLEEFVKKIGKIPETDADYTEKLARLKELKTQTPVYNTDKTEAIYPEIKKGGAAQRLTFCKRRKSMVRQLHEKPYH